MCRLGIEVQCCDIGRKSHLVEILNFSIGTTKRAMQIVQVVDLISEVPEKCDVRSLVYEYYHVQSRQ